jgi:hypothetical protein
MSKEIELKKKKAIVKRPDTSPMGYASQFLKDGGDLANLEKMMELQERHDKNQAKKAMAEFKKNPPTLEKTKSVDYATSKGRTQYKHADLGRITDLINSAMAEHGLTASWKTDQEKNIKVTCTITHALGYSESTSLMSSPDSSGGKNDIQAIGSTITYLQRYTLLALTGLAAHDQDDDGKGVESNGLPEEVKQEISMFSTVEELTAYYKHNIGNAGDSRKEFISVLAARKEEIVKEAMNADS